MTSFNTKGMKYNILNQEINRSLWIMSIILGSVFMLFLVIIPGTQEILQIKNIKSLTEPAIIQNVSIFILWIFIMIVTEPKRCLYLWSQNQNLEKITISKSELFTNILSNHCKFIGYVYQPIKNDCVFKSCIKVPLTDKEYNKIIEHLKPDEKHEKKCMNPDVTIEK